MTPPTALPTMRLTITINNQLLKQLFTITRSRSPSEAIRVAVEDYVRQQRIVALDRFRGKVRLDRRVVTWRHARH